MPDRAAAQVCAPHQRNGGLEEPMEVREAEKRDVKGTESREPAFFLKSHQKSPFSHSGKTIPS